MALQQITEDRKMYNAMQISFSSKDWTVIVQVVEKHKTEESRNKATRFKKYVLTDMQGTKIAAVTFNASIVPLDKLLLPFKRYKITDAGLKLANPKYRIGEYAYEWILSTNNLIEPLHDEVPYTLPCSFNFTKFSELYRFAERNEYIAVKALVIGSNAVHGSGSSTARDYILIDEEKIPLVLRVWEDFLDNEEIKVSDRLPEPTLVAGFTLRVTTYHGISLSTPMFNAYFMVDPPLPDAAHMYEWYKEHNMEIAELLKNKAYDDVEILLRPPTTSDVHRIKDVTTKVEEFKAAWVTGKLQLMPGQDQLWQSVCGNCKKYIKARVNLGFTCNSCGQNTVIVPRGRMEVYLTDDSGTICATVFSPLFEKLTALTGNQLFEADNKGQPLLKEVEEAISGKKIFCFLKFFKSEKNYTALQLYTEETVVDSKAIEVHTADTESLMDVAQEPTKETDQFFSPKTKAVLEEIADSVELKENASIHPPQSKRTLMFGSIPTRIPTTTSEKGAASVELTPMAHEVENPIKKLKNQEEKKEKAS